MKTLVTGGTGFIGSHLVEKLRTRGHDVVSVAKDGQNVEILNRLGVQVITGDLNNGMQWEKTLEGVDTIYHLAGVTRGRFAKDYYEGNTMATKRFVAVCSRFASSLKRFVYVSSLTAVGPSPDGSPVEEDAPYHPVSYYGKSKMLAELEVLRARAELPVTIVRPSAVYGPRDREWCEYIRLIVHGFQLMVGFRAKLMNLVHADDLTDGIILAAESPSAVGQIYFLGSERACSTREFGETIAGAVGKHPLRVPVPHAVAYAVGAVEGAVGKIFGRDVMFNLQKVRESVQHAWTCSISKAKAELGFSPRIPLDEGVRSTCEWYRKNRWI